MGNPKAPGRRFGNNDQEIYLTEKLKKCRKDHLSEKKRIMPGLPEDSCDLSVIVPAYNAEEYLKECLDSLTRQTGEFSWQIVLIDDGSTDQTMNLFKQFKESGKFSAQEKPHIEILRGTHNGTGAARNYGLEHATGRYVFFLDADDYIQEENYFSRLIFWANKSEADICEGERRSLTDGRFTDQETVKNVEVLKKYDEFFNHSGFATGKLFRKTLFEEDRFPEGYIFEDTLIQINIYPKCNKICCVPNIHYIYRIHKDSVTFRKDKDNRGVDAVLVVKELTERVESLHNAVTNFLWYMTIVNHFGELLYRRLRHCDRKTRRDAFRLACILTNKIATKMGHQEYRPLSFTDFCLQHRCYLLWLFSNWTEVMYEKFFWRGNHE